MKPLALSTPSVCLTILVFGLVAPLASAQTTILIDPTTNNGSFEMPANADLKFTTPTSATSPIPYWGATVAQTDSGVANGNTTEAGSQGAYLQPVRTDGTRGSAFNLVTSANGTIVAGTTYTLTFYARDTLSSTTAADPVSVSLFSQAAPTGATYSYNPTATLATITPTLVFLSDESAANHYGFTQYSFNYTATAADAGDIGLSITNNGSDYDAFDNFVLTATMPVVPEPGTVVGGLMLLGVGGHALVRRCRGEDVVTGARHLPVGGDQASRVFRLPGRHLPRCPGL